MRTVLKRIIPQRLWTFIRRKQIIAKHNDVAKICREIIAASDTILIPDAINDSIKGQKIIWQYWAQGYDDEQVPELVRLCLDSVERYKGDYIVIRLTDENIEEYIALPDFVREKRSLYPDAIFSDLLRTMLLTTYGGVWIDATVLLTGPIPQRYEELDFFMFQRDKREPSKEYWENVYAYYYGWHRDFRVRVLNSVIFAKKDSLVIRELCKSLLTFWKTETTLPDYFFYQILFHELINGKLAGHNCPIESDCRPHYLQQLLNDNFPYASAKEVVEQSTIHKLSYKTNSVGKLRQLLPDL